MIAPAFLLQSRFEAHQAALAINAVLSTSALLPIYWIARRTLPALASFAVTAVVAFLPSFFVYALALSAENLFLPLFWWGTLLLVRLSERDRGVDAVGAGLAIGLLPAVKLTGFAILAAGVLMGLGMAVFRRVHARRAAVLIACIILPQVIWVLVRHLFGAPERGLFGFGPGVGEALVEGLRRLDVQAWRTFLSFFVRETTYFMVGAYVAWIAFSLYLVSQYRTWRARSVEGLLLSWTFLSATTLAAVTVLLLFPIAHSVTDPDQRAREIYGRFIEVLFPSFFVLGTRGMIDFAWSERSRPSPGREAALVVLVVVFTAISFYPLTGYAVSSPFRSYAFGWLAERVAVGPGALVAFLLLPSAAALVWLTIGAARGRRVAVGLAGVGLLAVHVLVFCVTIVGVVQGARARDATLFRIGHWLERHAGPSTRIAYDAGLGLGDQYFAYRFWSGGIWDVVPPEALPSLRTDFVVTGRRLGPDPIVVEANGVKLYRLPARGVSDARERKPAAEVDGFGRGAPGRLATRDAA